MQEVEEEKLCHGDENGPMVGEEEKKKNDEEKNYFQISKKLTHNLFFAQLLPPEELSLSDVSRG